MEAGHRAIARRTHWRACNLCEATCGLRIELAEAERIVSIRGDERDPFSRGYICPKAVALQDVHEDPDRLRQPLRRTASGWQTVGWEAALDEAADRLAAVSERHGRNALGIYLGNPNIHSLGAMIFAPRLVRALRTRQRYSATSVDQLPHHLASYLMFGHQLLLPVPDIDRTDYFLVLGANPLASNGSMMTAPDVRARLAAIQRRGGRVVVVDPRRSETARVADEHLPIRPGTDALLLLALVHTVLEEGLVRDSAALGSATGLERLRQAAAAFAPERAAAPTGIAEATIRRLARELAAAERGVCYGRIGCSTQPFGSLCQWLINALNAVTGHLDRPGGAMFTQPAIDPLRIGAAVGFGRGSYGRWRSRVRGLPEFSGELPAAVLAEEMATPGEGQIRGLVTVAGNPVLSTPGGARLEKLLPDLDAMVAIDFYLNETTRHAHLILPPTSPLERSHYDLALYLLAIRNTARWSEPLFAAPRDSRHDWQILSGLERRLLERQRAPLRQRLESRLVAALGPDRLVGLGLRFGPYGAGWRPRRGRLSLARLRREPHGIDLGALAPCLLERLPAEQPGIDLAPAPLVADLERLATAFPQAGGVSAAGELLLVGRRHLRSNNSWMHNAPRLMSGRSRCTLLMHPDDARRLGLASGQRVRVRSAAGEIAVALEVSADLMPGVVSLPHGFGHHRPGTRLRVAAAHAGASLNDLTDPQAVDLPSGNAAFSATPVTVEAVSA